MPVINGVTVFFKHRDKLFSDNNVKDLNSSFSSFEYKVDSSRIYSLVRVGYDKQDYESMNGRDEFRFTTEYTTGIDITDNVKGITDVATEATAEAIVAKDNFLSNYETIKDIINIIASIFIK